MGQDLEILPVLNKIDLPGADADKVAGEVEDVIGLDCSEAIAASAKQGIGIEVSPWSGSQAVRGGQARSMTSAPPPSPIPQAILEEVVKKVPAPADTRHLPLRTLLVID